MNISAIWIGTLAYALIKIVGYSGFAYYLNQLYSKQNNLWKVGLARAALGVVLGLAHNAIFLNFFEVTMGRAPLGGEDTHLYFIGLIILRIFEWGLIVHWFYDSRLKNKPRATKAIVLGSIWSFVLDIPVLMGLFAVASSIC